MSDMTDRDAALDAAVFLCTHDGGWPNQEMSEALAAVTKAVKETGLKGSVTVTVDISRYTDNPDGPLSVGVKVARKVPSRGRAPAIWYATAEGDLVQNNPLQRALFEAPVEAYDPRKDQK